MSENLGNAWNQRELKWALEAANIQSQKERLMKMGKTEGHFEKGDSKN